MIGRKSFTYEFGHLYTPSDLEDYLTGHSTAEYYLEAMQRHTIIVAEYDGMLIGFAKYGAVGLPVQAANDAQELHRLYIDPDMQGKGAGRALGDAFLEANQSCSELYVGVWENNARAQKLYKSMGFEYIGEHHFMVGDHADRDLIMKRSA